MLLKSITFALIAPASHHKIMFNPFFNLIRGSTRKTPKSIREPQGTRELVAAAYRCGGTLDIAHCTYGPALFKKDSDYGYMPYYRLLAGLVNLLGLKVIVEVGTYHGGSTLALAAGLTGQVGEKILTIDPETHAQDRLASTSSIKAFQGTFPDAECMRFLNGELGASRIDLLYIDALKDAAFLKESLKACEKWRPRLIVLDDINANDSMEGFWLKHFSRQSNTVRLSDLLQNVRNSEFDFGIIVNDPSLLHEKAANIAEWNSKKAFTDICVGGDYSFALHDSYPEVRTMMSRGETGLLHRLARDRYQGLGEIVDAGAFLGGSTVALGLPLLEKSWPLYNRIHSYDRFTNFDPYFDRFMDPAVERYQSYLPQFLRNITPVRDYVNIYSGEFCQQKWCGKPIEIFFTDIAKSPTLNAHLYAEFSRYWIPGHTVYVQQDFVHLEAPWIQYVIGYLSDYFTIIGVEAPSLVLGVNAMIPSHMIRRIVDDDFTFAEKQDFLQKLSQRFDDPQTILALLLIRVRYIAESGNLEGAISELRSLEANTLLMAHKNSRRRVLRTKEIIGLEKKPGPKQS